MGKCSHFRASAYFIESFDTSCTFKGYAWSGGYDQAIRILERYKVNQKCDSCPIMGYKDSEDNAHGSYLVITGTKEKYCGKYILKFNFMLFHTNNDPIV